MTWTFRQSYDNLNDVSGGLIDCFGDGGGGPFGEIVNWDVIDTRRRGKTLTRTSTLQGRKAILWHNRFSPAIKTKILENLLSCKEHVTTIFGSRQESCVDSSKRVGVVRANAHVHFSVGRVNLRKGGLTSRGR